MNKRTIAVILVILLSASLFGASLAEETNPSPVEVDFHQVVATAEATAAPEAITVNTDAPAADPTASVAPEVTDAAATEPVATAEASATPAASETPADPTATPELTAAPAVPERSVAIHMDVPQDLKLGDTVTLTATLTGYDNVAVALQWQFSKDGETWTDAQGANELTYAFQVSDDTANTVWRLGVTAQ